MGVRQPPVRKLPNLAAARAVRALELLAFEPFTAPTLAEAMGIDRQTARRLLVTLADEGYLQRGQGTSRRRHRYMPTPRLLALAGQLARGLPLVASAERLVARAHDRTGLDAYVTIPSYDDILVLASAGRQAPSPWSLQPARDSAAGSVLLAYRQSWRDHQRPDDETRIPQPLGAGAADVRRRGYAVHRQGNTTSLAVSLATVTPAALAVSGAPRDLSGSARDRVVAVLLAESAELGDAD